MKNPLLKIVELQKAGEPVGIYSACSANKYVIEAVIEQGKKDNSVVLIEATANQVDQFGGYTGMKPADFKAFVEEIAKEKDFDMNMVILGGDHLGPLTWTNIPNEEAMSNAEDLIEAYVKAGFTKIHIDTSMRLSEDSKTERLSDEIIAGRGARLAKVAKKAFEEVVAERPDAIEPVYVIGSEVPIPGGASNEDAGMAVTEVNDFVATHDTFQRIFEEEGLETIWDHVIAMVVQPGVEYGDAEIDEYNREDAKDLSKAVKSYDVVFEGHSTDYQTPEHLRQMVEDGVGVLKVGPWLTFALREGIFALEKIERELIGATDLKASDFENVLEKAMLDEPKNWEHHYQGNDHELQIKRKFSFSDRARYYLPQPTVVASLEQLISNMNQIEIPLSVLSQFMPVQYKKVRHGELALEAEALIKDFVVNVIEDYMYATHQEKLKF